MDISGLQITDRDAALMAIGTAFGGLQTIVLKRVLNEPPKTGASIITSTSGVAALAVGLAFIGVGVGARTGMIPFNKDISTLMLGYGLSAVISLGLMYLSTTILPAPSPRGVAAR